MMLLGIIVQSGSFHVARRSPFEKERRVSQANLSIFQFEAPRFHIKPAKEIALQYSGLR